MELLVLCKICPHTKGAHLSSDSAGWYIKRKNDLVSFDEERSTTSPISVFEAAC